MPKRDLERIREILFQSENIPVDPDEDFYSGYVDLMNDIDPEDAYQLLLMRDAGFIEGRDVNLGIFRVTSAGHDYLDAVRDRGVWEKTKDAVAETGGSASLELLKTMALAFVKSKLEHHTGLEL